MRQNSCGIIDLRMTQALVGLSSLAICISTFTNTASAQSPQASREWALFNQVLVIGIGVGIVVFALLFYAIIRYREKPVKKDDA